MNERLAKALRSNRARLILPAWRERLTFVSGIQSPRFLSLDQTDSLRSEFYGKLSSLPRGGRRNIARPLFDDLRHRIHRFSIQFPEQDVVLFSSVDSLIGAVEMPSNILLAHFSEIWEVVEDDFRTMTSDTTSGLCVELNYNDLEEMYIPNGIYELGAWGKFTGLLSDDY